MMHDILAWMTEDSLVPGKNPRLGSTTLENWLKN